MNAEKVALGLGWFSLGLGLTETLAPQWVNDALGLGDRAWLVRQFGLREIGAGAGLLAKPDASDLMWARVSGDVLDLAALASALGGDNPKRPTALGWLIAVAGITVVDVLVAQGLSQRPQE